MRHQTQRLRRAASSLLVIATLFVAAPACLVAISRFRFGAASPLAGIAPPWKWSGSDISTTVSEPLRDDAVINLVIRTSLTVIWVALMVMALTVVSELVHMVRHRGIPAPRVRGMGWAQGISRFIAVGLIAALPITSVGSTAGAIGTSSSPATTSQRSITPLDTFDSTNVASIRFDASSTDVDASPQTTVLHSTKPFGAEHRLPRQEPSDAVTQPTVHVVERSESIYGIAGDYANGDASLTIEIADGILDLNLSTVMNDGRRFTNPALVQPGWELQLPTGIGIPRIDIDETILNPNATYVVVEGDTLSDIAAHQLGDHNAWPEIWEENCGDLMPGNRTFDDPHLILPDWELDIANDPPPATEEHTSNPALRPDPAPAEGTPNTTHPAAVPPPAAPPEVTASPTDTTPATTVAGVPANGGASDGSTNDTSAPRTPSPIRLEHAALLAAGVLTLIAVRRRRSLRTALPHARVPAPAPEVAATERRLRAVDPGERAARVDVCVRAIAHHLAETGVQIGTVRVAPDGLVAVRLTGPSMLPAPWIGAGPTWTLPASVSIKLLTDDARKVGHPCLALVMVGVDSQGSDVLIDLEAAAVMTIEAQPDQADEIVRAIGSGLATSLTSEVIHLLVAGLGTGFLFDHPNTRLLTTPIEAQTAAVSLVGSTLANNRPSFDLRTRRTGGEMWEPAVMLFGSNDAAHTHFAHDALPPTGRGLAIVAATPPGGFAAPGARIVAHTDRWTLEAFNETIGLTPIGLTTKDIAAIVKVLDDAARPIEPSIPTDANDAAQPLTPHPHDVIVSLMGGVQIINREGAVGRFERSKTIELIAWLATHRERSTRAAARTALWEIDVRDATFANVVSEARRGLGRFVSPPEGSEWLARTLTESLPLHKRVVTDVDLIRQRVEHARLAPPAHAIDVLRPAVEMIRGLPFAGTSYLWPDADGITSNLVLLATTASGELAGHALSVGDTDLVFWATGQGLKVLPGHEELIGLRMRAHARAGDLVGVRNEWESYERVIMADSWSDGEPAPKLLDLRRELLSPSA